MKKLTKNLRGLVALPIFIVAAFLCVIVGLLLGEELVIKSVHD